MDDMERLQRRVILENHLMYNFYPPMSPRLAPLAEAAIDNPEGEIDLEPLGMEINGSSLINAAVVIDWLELGQMVEGE